jgi:hypothetical protein
LTGVGRDADAFRNGILGEDKNAVVIDLNDWICVDPTNKVDRPCAISDFALGLIFDGGFRA